MKRKDGKPKKGSLPDGTIRVDTRSDGKKVTYKKENGKWIYQKKYPNGFTDQWGNYSTKGRGDTNSVIGKYGPRPELRTLVYGVGENDVMIPEFTKTRFWRTWAGILRRTDYRDIKWLESHKVYEGCTLDPRWFKLSTFKEWVEQWEDHQNKEIDKDILIPGNKIYGPDTCLMVRPIVNSWFMPNAGNSGLPKGVSWNTGWKLGKSPNPYRSQITPIGGKRKHLGNYATIEEAYASYEKARKEQIQILIETETDPRVIKAMLDHEFK